MAPGPHIFGDGRLGCWFIFHEDTNFNDQLKHRVPRIKSALGVTDCFLPREATLTSKKVVTDAGCFFALYERPPHGATPQTYAQVVLDDVNRLKAGAVELNIEGLPDGQLKPWLIDTLGRIRKQKPQLRIRINVVPWKGQSLPVDLLQDDPQFFVIVQNYIGNMDGRVPEDQIMRDLIDHGCPPAKASIMYGAHIEDHTGKRVPSLPVQVRYRGSYYMDDLIADAGYIT